MERIIWIKCKKFYLYRTYDRWVQALNVSKRFRKKNKCRYFIIKYETGLFNEQRFALYLDKIINLW